jgi:hypothetical protein
VTLYENVSHFITVEADNADAARKLTYEKWDKGDEFPDQESNGIEDSHVCRCDDNGNEFHNDEGGFE